jgi:hypothetical protein
MTMRSTKRQANYMNAAEKAREKVWGKMGGGKLKSGFGSWQSQGVSNPCLHRERTIWQQVKTRSFPKPQQFQSMSILFDPFRSLPVSPGKCKI